MEILVIKKILSIAVLAASLGLGACATGGVVGSSPAPSTDPTVAQIQETAAKVCGFVPTISTVTGIIASFFPGGAPINTLVSGVANAICTAVVPTASGNKLARGPRGGPTTVGGVKIEGYFLR